MNYTVRPVGGSFGETAVYRADCLGQAILLAYKRWPEALWIEWVRVTA